MFIFHLDINSRLSLKISHDYLFNLKCKENNNFLVIIKKHKSFFFFSLSKGISIEEI